MHKHHSQVRSKRCNLQNLKMLPQEGYCPRQFSIFFRSSSIRQNQEQTCHCLQLKLCWHCIQEANLLSQSKNNTVFQFLRFIDDHRATCEYLHRTFGYGGPLGDPFEKLLETLGNLLGTFQGNFRRPLEDLRGPLGDLQRTFWGTLRPLGDHQGIFSAPLVHLRRPYGLLKILYHSYPSMSTATCIMQRGQTIFL